MVKVAIGGRFRARDGAAVLTDRRLLLSNNREWDPEVVSLDRGAGIEVEHWVQRRAAILRFTAGGEQHVMDRVNDLTVAEVLVEALRDQTV